ncbi:hypothetical protein [Pseudomonas sp. nanlin1]
MNRESQREDLDHQPDNAGDVGEEHKHLNEQGEQPREPESEAPEKGGKP